MSRYTLTFARLFIAWSCLEGPATFGQDTGDDASISGAVQPPPGVEVRVIEMPTPVDSDVGASEDAGIDPQTPVPGDAPVVPFEEAGPGETRTEETGAEQTPTEETGTEETGTEETGTNDGNSDDAEGSFTIEGDAVPSYEESKEVDDEPTSGIKLYGNRTPPPGSQNTSGEKALPPPEYQPVRLRLRQQTDSNLFGSYRIRLSGVQPSFSEMPLYSTLYGEERWYPTLQADWFAFDWYATLGLTYRIGYYTAKGHAAQESTSSDIGGIGTSNSANSGATESVVKAVQKDLSGPTELTFLPLQAGITAEFTPFNRKWLVLDIAAGLERAFLQEVRTGSSGGQANSDDEYLTSSTWKSSLFLHSLIKYSS